jgi:hypothetical protein
MDLKPGSRWKSTVCDVEVVIVRSPKAPTILECGGHQMVPHAANTSSDLRLEPTRASGSQAGKRFEDVHSGLEVLCTKSGVGSLAVDGRLMGPKVAKKLPSSD